VDAVIGETGDTVAVKAIIDHNDASPRPGNAGQTRVVVTTGPTLHDVVAWVPDENVVMPLVPRVEELIENMERRARWFKSKTAAGGTPGMPEPVCRARQLEAERTVRLLRKLLDPDT